MLKMSKDLEKFLERRGEKYLKTPNPNYEELYYYANCDVVDDKTLPMTVGELTDTLIYLKFNPLKSHTMTYLPSYFMFHSEQEELTIPEEIERIYQWACAYSAIEKVVIPYSVKQIDEEAFYHCEDLKRIIYLGTMDEWNEINMHENAFKGCPNLITLEAMDDELRLK